MSLADLPVCRRQAIEIPRKWIEVLAYYRWLAGGRQLWQHQRDWLAAESSLDRIVATEIIPNDPGLTFWGSIVSLSFDDAMASLNRWKESDTPDPVGSATELASCNSLADFTQEPDREAVPPMNERGQLRRVDDDEQPPADGAGLYHDPFVGLAPEVLESYRNRVVAVSLITNRILAVADDSDALAAEIDASPELRAEPWTVRPAPRGPEAIPIEQAFSDELNPGMDLLGSN